jgi:hypothetical protein
MRLEHRNLLIDIIPKLLVRLDFENLVRAVGQAAVLNRVAGGASYDQATNFIVVAASEEGWVAALNDQLAARFPNRSEFVDIKKALADIVPTTADPFREVLLDGDRPFVNRKPLRRALLTLVDTSGDRVLVVNGKEKTGKSFSFYLLDHAVTRNGFKAHLFDMSSSPSPLQLAEDIMQRIPVTVQLSEQGSESAERWAKKLAGDIQRAVLMSNLPRFFVFDNFPDTLATAGEPTLHLISRLATLAYQDLRTLLRVVLVRFPLDRLDPDIEDVITQEEVQPFTPTDMLEGLMQIANARQWGITEAAAKDKIDEFEAQKAQTLRDRFRFLRKMVRELSDAANAAVAQP